MPHLGLLLFAEPGKIHPLKSGGHTVVCMAGEWKGSVYWKNVLPYLYIKILSFHGENHFTGPF